MKRIYGVRQISLMKGEVQPISKNVITDSREIWIDVAQAFSYFLILERMVVV